MAVSFFQRLVEGAITAPFQAAKHGFMGAARNPFKASSYRRHGESLWNDLDSNTINAIEDTGRWLNESRDIMKDKNRHWARRGLAGAGFLGKGVFGAAHTTMAFGMDAVKAPINIGARAAGVAVGAATRVTAGAAWAVGKPVTKATMKGSWWLAKNTVPGVTKATAMAGSELVKTAAYTAAGTGKALWKHRNNPMMGSAIVGGAIIAGGVMGKGQAYNESLYGTENGGPGGWDKGMGYMNPQIQAPAWQLTQSAITPTGAQVQQSMNQKGGYQAIKEVSDIGASGDLVFALNNLRNGGMM